MSKKSKLSPKYQIWIDARKNYRLTHVQIQMARELGYNPKMLKKIHEDESLKLPLHLYIEEQYKEEFKKDAPDEFNTIEGLFNEVKRKSAARKKE
jgi:hypothetical protein